MDGRRAPSPRGGVVATSANPPDRFTSDYPNVRDCEHGHLRRSCETCEYEARIAELEAELAEAKRWKPVVDNLREIRTGLEKERDAALADAAENRHWMRHGRHIPGCDDCEDLAVARAEAETLRAMEIFCRACEEYVQTRADINGTVQCVKCHRYLARLSAPGCPDRRE